MSGKILLDTNIVIALFAGEPAVLSALSGADEIYVPTIVLGELFYGAQKSERRDLNIARICDFAESSVVVGVNRGTAEQYGLIKNQLRAKGKPIPENDIWIAAIALSHNLELATRDDHFREIDSLVRYQL